MPRPVPRSRFSSASGSGTDSGSKPSALVGDGEYQVLAGVFKAHRNLPGGVVLVAVKDGVYSRLAHRHGHMESFFLVQACFGGQFFCCCLHFADALHRRAETETQPSSPGFAHWVRIPPSP